MNELQGLGGFPLSPKKDSEVDVQTKCLVAHFDFFVNSNSSVLKIKNRTGNIGYLPPIVV
jgi:hypothetical protein